MSNPNMVPIGSGGTATQIGGGFIQSNPDFTAEQLAKHLESRQKTLQSLIGAMEIQVAALADRRAELVRVTLAIAALNGHPDPADAPVELFGCTTCERTFTTQRGLTRHARVHKPPTALDVLDP